MEPIRLAGDVEDVDPGRSAVAGYRQLAAAVVLQALYDARQRNDPALRVEAITWLASDDSLAICDVLGVGDVFAVVLNGSKAPRLRGGGWRISRNR